MSLRRLGVALLVLVAILVALGAGAALLLATVDLRPRLERYASRSLDRRLTIAGLKIAWGDPLGVEIDDLRLANPSWAKEPDMLRIAHLSAAIDLWPLLHGELRYRRLRLVRPVIVLERDPAGAGNWKFPHQGSGAGGFALVPKNRTQFPTLLDAALADGELDYRTSSGAWLRLKLADLAIRAAGDDGPASLWAEGSYNGVAARLAATLQSFAALRQGSAPVGASFTLTTAPGTVDFTGTMMHPLDFDGLQGKLRLSAPKLGAFLAIVGAGAKAGFRLVAAGGFRKEGDHWALSDATGKLAADAFTGSMALDEGPRAHPDHIALALDFARLDLTALLAGQKAGGDLSLQLDRNPGATVAARIGATRLDYRGQRFDDVAASGRSDAGALELSALSFAFAGGRVDVAAAARAVAGGSRLTASASASGVDAGALAAKLGAPPGQIAGRLDAGADLDMTGATLDAALKASQGRLVVAMSGGRVARDLLEKASTDLRSLFRAGAGTAQITCLLGVMQLRDGIGFVAPLRLRTPETSLVGGGDLDFLRRRVDLTIKAEGSSSLLALQLPLRVSGDLASPHIAPVIGPSAATANATALPATLPQWPPALRQLVEGNACLR